MQYSHAEIADSPLVKDEKSARAHEYSDDQGLPPDDVEQ